MSKFADLTIINRLMDAASTLPKETPLFQFVGAKGEQLEKYTYHDFNERSAHIAYIIRHHLKVPRGDTVLLVFPPGLEFFVAFYACIRCGVLAVPVSPPHPQMLNKDIPRFNAVWSDCGAQWALSTSSYMASTAATGALSRVGLAKKVGAAWPAGLRWHAIDGLNRLVGAARSGKIYNEVTKDDLAFLQYTSGSTGNPKGVMVSHANVMHNNCLALTGPEGAPDNRLEHMRRGVTWLPMYHDMGLFFVHLTVYAWGYCTLMSPITFLKDPMIWPRLITREGATALSSPTFSYALITKKFTPGSEHIDFSTVEHACIAAEPVYPQTMEGLFRKFGPYGIKSDVFSPTFGLAEHTVFVCDNVDGPLKVHDGRVCVGYPARHLGVDIRIVDPETLMEVEDGVHGEIWLDSPSKCAGYFKRPEVSEATFYAKIVPGGKQSTISASPGGYLRTGDQGFSIDGGLYVTGRIKDLIIIRGRNLYPNDVEKTMEDDDQGKLQIRPGCVAAFSIEVKDEEVGCEEGLVLVAEVRSVGCDCTALADSLFNSIAYEHGVAPYAVVLLPPRTIPKTTSGKIQRHATRNGYLTNTLNVCHVQYQPSFKSHPAALDKKDPASAESTPSKPSVVSEAGDGTPLYVVFGVDGAVPWAMVRALVRRKLRARVVCSPSCDLTGLSDLIVGGSVDVFTCYLDDTDGVLAALDGATHVVNFLHLLETGRTAAEYRAATQSLRVILEAAASCAGMARFIHVTASDTQIASCRGLARVRAVGESEKVVTSFTGPRKKLDYAIIRPGLVYGSGCGMLTESLSGARVCLLPTSLGRWRVDFCHVDHLVEAVLEACHCATLSRQARNVHDADGPRWADMLALLKPQCTARVLGVPRVLVRAAYMLPAPPLLERCVHDRVISSDTLSLGPPPRKSADEVSRVYTPARDGFMTRRSNSEGQVKGLAVVLAVLLLMHAIGVNPLGSLFLICILGWLIRWSVRVSSPATPMRASSLIQRSPTGLCAITSWSSRPSDPRVVRVADHSVTIRSVLLRHPVTRDDAKKVAARCECIAVDPADHARVPAGFLLHGGNVGHGSILADIAGADVGALVRKHFDVRTEKAFCAAAGAFPSVTRSLVAAGISVQCGDFGSSAGRAVAWGGLAFRMAGLSAKFIQKKHAWGSVCADACSEAAVVVASCRELRFLDAVGVSFKGKVLISTDGGPGAHQFGFLGVISLVPRLHGVGDTLFNLAEAEALMAVASGEGRLCRDAVLKGHGKLCDGELDVRTFSGRRECAEALVSQAASVLGCSPNQVDADRDVSTLGLDSIKLVQFSKWAAEHFSVVVEPENFMGGATLHDIAGCLESKIHGAEYVSCR